MNALCKTRYWRHALLLFIAAGSLVLLLTRQPFGQDLRYHEFADSHRLLGVSNFFNVVSNLPFLFVGIAGVWFCWRNRTTKSLGIWAVFFVGVGLVSLGSGWYHLWPDNGSLVWDRLPMTIGFMAMVVALLTESVSEKIGRWLLFPALLAGAWSVLHWHWFDDLRFYAWVQFAPLLVIPAMMTLFPARYSHRRWLLVSMGFYVLAKVCEALDHPIFGLTFHTMGGHALKHLFAAASCWAVLEMLRKRTSLMNG